LTNGWMLLEMSISRNLIENTTRTTVSDRSLHWASSTAIGGGPRCKKKPLQMSVIRESLGEMNETDEQGGDGNPGSPESIPSPYNREAPLI
jgi:hypothetical protein